MDRVFPLAGVGRQCKRIGQAVVRSTIGPPHRCRACRRGCASPGRRHRTRSPQGEVFVNDAADHHGNILPRYVATPAATTSVNVSVMTPRAVAHPLVFPMWKHQVTRHRLLQFEKGGRYFGTSTGVLPSSGLSSPARNDTRGGRATLQLPAFAAAFQSLGGSSCTSLNSDLRAISNPVSNALRILSGVILSSRL